MFDINNGRAIYLQIVDDICDRILTGELTADSRIPSVREYAAQVEVNVNTVMRAYDYLSGLEIIYNKRGLGYFTAAGARSRVIELRRNELLGSVALNFFRQLSLLEITPDQVAEMYRQYLLKAKEQ